MPHVVPVADLRSLVWALSRPPAIADWALAESSPCAEIDDAGLARLSINHEFNGQTVAALTRADPAARASRHPYWMRRGYVEELISFR